MGMIRTHCLDVGNKKKIKGFQREGERAHALSTGICLPSDYGSLTVLPAIMRSLSS